MSRAYGLNAVAHAIDANPKWLDNLLTHNKIDGVEHAGHGVPRRLAPNAVTIAYITRQLFTILGMPTAIGVEVACKLAENGSVELTPDLTISLNSDVLQRHLHARLMEGVQEAPPKRRGRPPRR